VGVIWRAIDHATFFYVHVAFLMLPRGYVDLRHGSDQDRRGQLLVSPKERGHAEQELHGNIGRSQVKPANYTELGDQSLVAPFSVLYA
jgi:hypothetical protein